MENLRISLIQASLAWENKAKNLDYFSKQLDHLRHATDLILLPEMFTTGFSMAAETPGRGHAGKLCAMDAGDGRTHRGGDLW